MVLFCLIIKQIGIKVKITIWLYDKIYMVMKMYINVTRLKDIRKDRDLTQKDIAKILNTSQVQYSRYEMGIRLLPIDKLVTLANYYNVSTDYLIGLTNERKPYPKAK